MTPGFRHELRGLSPADTLTVLGWLLDPGADAPHPDLPDDMLDALAPLYEVYCRQYRELAAIATGED